MHGRFPHSKLHEAAALSGRRRIAAFATLAVYGLLLVWLASILNLSNLIDLAIFASFAVAAPWSVLGVFNATIGFWLLHFRPDPLSEVAPFAAAGDRRTALLSRTAMLLTIRNEDASRAFARLRAMKASVDATGEGRFFDWFVLSDTTDAEIAGVEQAEFRRWRAEDDGARLRYRRRESNIGYKAGNIRDFCDRWGATYEFMIPLDADSLMDGAAVVRLVRIGDAHPEIGILQSLVVGAPSRSAFARIFQFGMRQGMRVYTMGATWWAGDCGPYWGHNALVRVAPFRDHCELPTKGGRRLLSHDQIEAVLMRRAGFEVRALPLELGSFEENPPTLLDFMQRDLRWCRGNMQYFALLGTPGLLPMSRFQLVWAISMFNGAPAWTAIVALAALKPAVEDVTYFPAASAEAFYLLFLMFFLAPRLLGFLDILATPKMLARYGGALRFVAGAICEVILSFILGAVMTLNVTLFLVTLPLARAAAWSGQARDAHGLAWRDAARALGPQLLFGIWVMALSGLHAPRLLLWSLPLTLGYVVAIPFAVATASARVGAWCARVGLCATPEQITGCTIFDELQPAAPTMMSAADLAHAKSG